MYVDTAVDETLYIKLKTDIQACGGGTIVRPYKNLSSHIDGIRSKKMNQDDIQKDTYKYVLVLEFGERTLGAALVQDRIDGGSDVAKHIMKGITQACRMLHDSNYIHGDLKPNNIVLVGTNPKLIDLDVSCQIGEVYGIKNPSTGYTSPEVACHIISKSIQSLKATISHDLFSLGVILFLVETGRSLWNTDRDDNIVKEESRQLLKWKVSLLDGKLQGVRCSVEAKDLLEKLLDPNPERRCSYFADKELSDGNKMMANVLKDPYFCKDGIVLAAVEKNHDIMKKMDKKIDVIDKKVDVIGDNVETIKSLTISQQKELKTMKENLMRAIYEATEINVPTIFVITKTKIHIPNDKETQDIKNRVASLIENVDEIGNDANDAVALSDQALSWLKIFTPEDDKGGEDDEEDPKYTHTHRTVVY